MQVGHDFVAGAAPFTDLSDATVVVTGTRLIVVGGHHGILGDWVLPGKAWTFDLTG